MLIGNGRLIDKIPLTYLGRDGNAQLQAHIYASATYPDNFGAKAAMPDGYYSPQGWALPRTAGAMSARNRQLLTVAGSGLAYGGITTTGTGAISFTVADAAGELISSGSGTASFSFTFANALLTASLNAVGSASFSILTNTPTLGAEASGLGSATFAITGTLTPYAIGIMSGSTVDASTVVNANIVSVNGYSVTGTGQPGTEWGPV